ncbi:MAG: sialidase family protein [Armatimonadota bacterium]
MRRLLSVRGWADCWKSIGGVAFCAGLLCVVISTVGQPPPASRAQGRQPNWDNPIVLTSQHAFLFDDVMVADVAGNLHVFWVGWCGDEPNAPRHDSEPTDETLDVCYLRKDRLSGWSSVANILRVPRMIPVPAAVADNHGVLHLIWRDDRCLWYSWSSIDEARRPQPWIEHQRCLGKAVPTYQAMAYDGVRDRLYVLYVVEEGYVVVTRSDDGGVTWSRPYYVAEPRGAGDATEQAVFAGYPALSLDRDGTLHATWSTFPNSGYPSQGLFYARSTDGGATWSEPFELAGVHHTQARVLAYGRASLVAMWNGDIGISGRYSRRSDDGGVTWSELDLVLPTTIGGGMVGAPALAADQMGIIHALLPTDSWIYYVTFDGQRWSVPVQMNVPSSYLDGTAIMDFAKNDEETHTPDMVITEGNQLHAVWTARYTYLLCYATSEVGGVHQSAGAFAPPRQAPTRPSPVTGQTAETTVAISTQATTADVAPRERVTLAYDNFDAPGGMWWPIIAGVVPIAAFLLCLFAVRRRVWRDH